MRAHWLIAAVIVAPIALAAQGHGSHAGHAARAGGAKAGQGDSAFAAVQQRGRQAMGVDQYTSAHQFEALPDGGRIELQRAPNDTAGVAIIRRHLREVAGRFAAGDFTTPAFVHARDVPGARTMAARRRLISYEFRELPGGGEIRITTRDRAALTAVHEFLAFQRQDHRVR
jgi:hypothetical protein